jgi:hypothetical protein
VAANEKIRSIQVSHAGHTHALISSACALSLLRTGQPKKQEPCTTIVGFQDGSGMRASLPCALVQLARFAAPRMIDILLGK